MFQTAASSAGKLINKLTAIGLIETVSGHGTVLYVREIRNEKMGRLRMEIQKLNIDFTICKVADYSQTNLDADYTFIAKTDAENSLVCPAPIVPSNTIVRDDGWKGFRIQGVLDFSLIGILSKLSGILAENKIGIFAVSTYNTDYILVKAENFDRARDVLEEAGYTLV